MTSTEETEGSAVLQALAAGDHKALAEVLAAGGDVNDKDRWGVPALGLAAGRGDLEAMRLLLDHGGDPNLASAVGNAPLMIAAARGQTEAVRALLAAGANPGTSNDWGLSAADWARWAKDPIEMRALLAEAG